MDDAFFMIHGLLLGAGRGRIDVVPSFGAMSLTNARESWQARACVFENEDKKGEPRSFLSERNLFVAKWQVYGATTPFSSMRDLA